MRHLDRRIPSYVGVVAHIVRFKSQDTHDTVAMHTKLAVSIFPLSISTPDPFTCLVSRFYGLCPKDHPRFPYRQAALYGRHRIISVMLRSMTTTRGRFRVRTVQLRQKVKLLSPRVVPEYQGMLWNTLFSWSSFLGTRMHDVN